MKRIVKITPFIFGICTILCSCEHKELCFNYDEVAPKSDVQIVATYDNNWEYPYKTGTVWRNLPTWAQTYGFDYNSLCYTTPEGLRVQVYNANGSNDVSNIAPQGGIVNMRPGEHAILFYNNETEYIVFNEIQSFAAAKATTRVRSRSTYKSKSEGGEIENTVNQPDVLFGNYVSSFQVQRSNDLQTLSITMHPLVFTYLVRFEFNKGLEYVALARGALPGMAEYVWLHDGHTSESAATVLFDCVLKDYGAEAHVRSFGIPDFPNEHYVTKSNFKHDLNLEVMLKNGKMKQFTFDVTDQVEKQPEGGVITVKDIEISDDEGWEGGSGFDVEVNDWGEYEDIELPLR